MFFFFQFREKRIEQEKELMQKQNSWLSDELKTKTDELVKLRKEKVPVVILYLYQSANLSNIHVIPL